MIADKLVIICLTIVLCSADLYVWYNCICAAFMEGGGGQKRCTSNGCMFQEYKVHSLTVNMSGCVVSEREEGIVQSNHVKCDL